MDPRSQIEAHSRRWILQILLNAHKYVESEPGVHRLRDSDSKFGFEIWAIGQSKSSINIFWHEAESIGGPSDKRTRALVFLSFPRGLPNMN